MHHSASVLTSVLSIRAPLALSTCLRASHKRTSSIRSYIAAGGLLGDDPNAAEKAAAFAVAMLGESGKVLMPHTRMPVQVRIGIHSGRIMVRA